MERKSVRVLGPVIFLTGSRFRSAGVMHFYETVELFLFISYADFLGLSVMPVARHILRNSSKCVTNPS